MEDVESLLGEIATLREMVAQRDAKLAELTAIEVQLKTAKLEIERLKLQLASLRRQRYGRSSEKLDREIAQLEMRLEDLEENLGEQIAAQETRPKREPKGATAFKPRPKPAGRKPLPAHLPREVVVHEPEVRCTCGNCDPARLVRIGETKTEVLEKIPARFKVIQHVRPKYACRICERSSRRRHRSCRTRRDDRGRGCWPMSPSRNSAMVSPSIGSPASSNARASRSTAPPWRSGWDMSPSG